MRHVNIQKSKKPNKNGGFVKMKLPVNRKVMKSYRQLSISYLHCGYSIISSKLTDNPYDFWNSS